MQGSGVLLVNFSTAGLTELVPALDAFWAGVYEGLLPDGVIDLDWLELPAPPPESRRRLSGVLERCSLIWSLRGVAVFAAKRAFSFRDLLTGVRVLPR